MQSKVRGRDSAVTNRSPHLPMYTVWHSPLNTRNESGTSRGDQTTTTLSTTTLKELPHERQPLSLASPPTRVGVERQAAHPNHGNRAIPTNLVSLSPSSSSSSAPRTSSKPVAGCTFTLAAPVPPTPLLSSPLHDRARCPDEVCKPAARLRDDGHHAVPDAPPSALVAGDVKGASYEEQVRREDAEACKDAFLRSLPQPPSESPFQTYPRYDDVVGGTGGARDGTPDVTKTVAWYNAIVQASDTDADRSRSPFTANGQSMRRLSVDRVALLGDEARNDTSEGEHEQVSAGDHPVLQRRGHLLRFRATRTGYHGNGSSCGGGNGRSESSNSYRNGTDHLSGGGAATTAAAATSDHSLTNLFVRNLPQTVDDEQLRRMFAQFGPIVSSAIMRNIHTGVSLGTAFVRYETHEQALAAFNYFGAGRRRSWDGLESELFAGAGGPDGASAGTTKPTRGSAGWSGKQVTVQWAKKEHDRTPAGAARRRMRKLFVRNIPRQITQEVLEQLFGQFGPLKSVSLHRDTIARGNVGVPLSSTPSALTGHGKNGGGVYGSNASSLQEALLEERRIAFVTYAIEGVAEEAAEAVHNTTPFASCRGIPLMVKLAEDAPGRHPQSLMQQQQQQLTRQLMSHGGSVHNSLNSTLVSVTSETMGGSGPLNSLNQPPGVGVGSPFANTITTNECHYDTMSHDWCSPLGTSLRGMSSHDFASVSLNATQNGISAAVGLAKGAASNGGSQGNTLGDTSNGLAAAGSPFHSLRDMGGEWAGQSVGSRAGLDSSSAHLQSSPGYTQQSGVGLSRFISAGRTMPHPLPAPALSAGWGLVRGEGGGGGEGRGNECDGGGLVAGQIGADDPEGFYARYPGDKDELATQTYPPPRGRSFAVASTGGVGGVTVAVMGPARRASTPQIVTTGGVLMSMSSARLMNGSNVSRPWHVPTFTTTLVNCGENNNNNNNNNDDENGNNNNKNSNSTSAAGLVNAPPTTVAVAAHVNSKQQPGLSITDAFASPPSSDSATEAPYFGNPDPRGPAPSYGSNLTNTARNLGSGGAPAAGVTQPVRLFSVSNMGSASNASTCQAQGRVYSAPTSGAARRQTAMLPQPRSSLIAREQQKQQSSLTVRRQQGNDGDVYGGGRHLNTLWSPSSGPTHFASAAKNVASGQTVMSGATGTFYGVALSSQDGVMSTHPTESAAVDGPSAYPTLLSVNDGRDTATNPPPPRQSHEGETPTSAAMETRPNVVFHWPTSEDVVAQTSTTAAAMTASSLVQLDTRSNAPPEERDYHYATTAMPPATVPGLVKDMTTQGDVGGTTVRVAPTLWSNEATDSTYYDLTSSSLFMGGPSPYLNDDTLTLVQSLTYDTGAASRLGSTVPATAACTGQAEPSQLHMSQTIQRMLHLTLDADGPESDKPLNGEARTTSNDDDDEDVFLLLNEIERAATVEDSASSCSHDT